jgi:uncharacterized protein
MDYAGIIIGKDLGYDKETKSLVVRRDEFKGKGAKPAKPKKGQTDLVRSTYKTLMTKGMKGCYVYCCDKGLEEFIRKQSKLQVVTGTIPNQMFDSSFIFLSFPFLFH